MPRGGDTEEKRQNALAGFLGALRDAIRSATVRSLGPYIEWEHVETVPATTTDHPFAITIPADCDIDYILVEPSAATTFLTEIKYGAREIFTKLANQTAPTLPANVRGPASERGYLCRIAVEQSDSLRLTATNTAGAAGTLTFRVQAYLDPKWKWTGQS